MPRKIAYWGATGLVTIVTLLAGFSYLTTAPEAVENFRHVGYPQQLRVLLGIAKLAGAIVLLLPRLPTLKEWAYAGFTFMWIAASVAHYLAGDGALFLLPVALIGSLAVLYVTRPANRRIGGCRAHVGSRRCNRLRRQAFVGTSERRPCHCARAATGRVLGGLLEGCSNRHPSLCDSNRLRHSSLGQQSVELASVSGRVTDSSGAVVPGAQVTARHTQTNVTRPRRRSGRPVSVSLPEGRAVRNHGACSGIQRRRASADPAVGAAFELPVTLSVGGVDTSVTVTGDATVLEAARSQIAGTVSQAEVRSLPMNGRNFLDLALLVPGVSPTNVGSTQLFPETSAVPGVSLSVGSQRNLSNNFIVDGLSANDDAAGLSGITVRRRCRRAVSGGHLGRAGGARPRPGRLRQRGDQERHESCTATVYDYFRDDRFNARERAALARSCR